MPRCLPNTQANQTAVRYIGNASQDLNVSIHAPGFGRREASAGTKPISRKGKARPKPNARKTSIAGSIGAVKA